MKGVPGRRDSRLRSVLLHCWRMTNDIRPICWEWTTMNQASEKARFFLSECVCCAMQDRTYVTYLKAWAGIAVTPHAAICSTTYV